MAQAINNTSFQCPLSDILTRQFLYMYPHMILRFREVRVTFSCREMLRGNETIWCDKCKDRSF